MIKDSGKKRLGLVLIELLTVLFIIAAIVMITIPNFRWQVKKVQLSVCQANLKNLSTALRLYANDHEDTYPESLTLLTPRYFKVLPSCPSAGYVTYEEGYVTDANLRNYTLYCWGKNHTTIGLGENEPYWSDYVGLYPPPK